VRPFTALNVAEVEAVPWPGGLTWHPLRMELGLRAFGAAAYTGDAGTTVVEPHTESTDGRGHEEVYIVLTGEAAFTLGEERLVAPAGTIVRVSPETFREAKATAAQTTVLAFGGPPSFELSGMEWTMRARPLLRSDPDRARAILADGLEQVPHSAAIPYGLALLEATLGDTEAAREALRTAVAREPRLRDEAAGEPLLRDLEP
jgi:mannose-6-phosphate isomerase-like protein (cupin superfamily)